MGVQVPLEIVLPILTAVAAVFALYVKTQGDRIKDKDDHITELKEYVGTYRDSIIPTVRELKDSQERLVVVVETYIREADRRPAGRAE